MRITEKISHAAERKAFETILDNLIQKGRRRTRDRSRTIL